MDLLPPLPFMEPEHLKGVLPDAMIAEKDDPEALTLVASGVYYDPKLGLEYGRDRHWIKAAIPVLNRAFPGARFLVEPNDLSRGGDSISLYRNVRPADVFLSCLVSHPRERVVPGVPPRIYTSAAQVNSEELLSRYCLFPGIWPQAMEKRGVKLLMTCVTALDNPGQLAAVDFLEAPFIPGPVLEAPYGKAETRRARIQTLFRTDFAADLCRRPDLTPEIRDSLRKAAVPA